MDDKEKRIQELSAKIERLTRQHQAFHAEIQQLQKAVFELRKEKISQEPPVQEPPIPVKKTEPEISRPVVTEWQLQPEIQVTKSPTPWEEFIGTNLLNKIGIAVLVIGIGFGAKYAIDRELLNPLTRIILGYISGVALIVTALRLRDNYKNFSAVLLSGGMAVLYFITYAAYDFYALIPQVLAFVLMVLFTAFTAMAAIVYNVQVIAIIGLVGAYAVPFLLSDGSGRVVILFSYITIINTGILFLAFKKYWKKLYYLAFIFTWLIFTSWFLLQYSSEKHFLPSLIFATVFFLIFYGMFLTYKLIRKEVLGPWDIVVMLLNSFLYFTYGYFTIESQEQGEYFLGLFTLFTALIHFIGALIIYRTQHSFNDIFYFVAGLVLVFLTLAVPVQLDGNWVTLVWASEAALLFWIGRTKSFNVYEKLSYPLIIIAFLSLLQDWSEFYGYVYMYEGGESLHITLFLNVQFFSSMFVAAMFGLILWWNRNPEYKSPLNPQSLLAKIIKAGLPLTILLIVYVGFFREIETFWDQRYAASMVKVPYENSDDFYLQYNEDLVAFKSIWLINYSALFGLLLTVVNLKYVKEKNLAYLGLGANMVILASFLVTGLWEISRLRESYLHETVNEIYQQGHYHIFIRYISLVLVLPLIWCNVQYIKASYFNTFVQRSERVVFHFIMLVLLSSELVHWLDMARVENSFKLMLTILWGGYALFLILMGLTKDLKYIRVTAIVLFGITLSKLFLYDMSGMSTISKTIVMMSLGILLLIASFLYNKHKRSAKV